MQVTARIHALKIPFEVPLSPTKSIQRFAFVYLLFGEKIHLIDSGVAGAEAAIYQYIEEQGRKPTEVASLILSHSHPDHIGAAKVIKERTGCAVFAPRLEQDWIEDPEKQLRERPVPGFKSLVAGPVEVDRLLTGGERLELEQNLTCQTIHTPGHSRGSLSLLFASEQSLFTADALIFPGDLPIYEDFSTCLASIKKLQALEQVENLFSSWETPVQGQGKISERMRQSIAYLQRIHHAVNLHSATEQEPMALCQQVVRELGLPPFAAMPLVAKAFASSLVAARH